LDTETAIERFILDEILLGSAKKGLDPSESLILSGILDSLGLLRLIAYVEKEFGILIEDGEVIPENFESIETINRFIANKKKG
jgi:acyl carrier protein